jgi:hypothetical protein
MLCFDFLFVITLAIYFQFFIYYGFSYSTYSRWRREMFAGGGHRGDYLSEGERLYHRAGGSIVQWGSEEL